MKNRLAALIGEKQRRENRVIKISEIAKATKLSRQVIYKWLNNELTDYRGDLIETFCDYFECDVNDLLVIVKEDVPDSIQN